METSDNIRKRVCRACDRCRMKKSKPQCDGARPCSRCNADNSICIFGEKKKSQTKVYPKGYVEMLEQQQAQLIAGLQGLYARLQRGQGWPGEPLREAQSGHPLTHDILERLRLLYRPSENGNNHEGFEEKRSCMQHKLRERGQALSCKCGPLSSDSEHGHHTPSPSSDGGTATTKSFSSIDQFKPNNAQPTSPIHNAFAWQVQTSAPLEKQSLMESSTFVHTDALNPFALSSTCMDHSIMTDVPIDFDKSLSGFDNFDHNFDQVIMMVDWTDTHPNDSIMPTWDDTTDLDFNNFVSNRSAHK